MARPYDKIASSVPMISLSGSPAALTIGSDYQPPASQRGVNWRTAFVMVLTFFLGVFGAIGHHIFYQSCVDKETSHQQWYVRAGTAIAFLSRALFAASVGISHRQRIWHTLRTKYISVGGIDALFSATIDPFSLLNIDMVFYSKLSTFMAILSWILPLSAVVVLATLSVKFKEFGPFFNDTHVPYINLTISTNFTEAKTEFPMSLVYTSTDSKHSFLGAGPVTQKLITSTLLSGDIAVIPAPFPANCSYAIEFHAPAFSCQNQVDESLHYPDPNKFAPGLDNVYGIFAYYAMLVPVDVNSTDGKLGLVNRLQVLTRSGPLGKGVDVEGQVALCAPHNAIYSVKITFVGGNPTYKIQNLTLLSPLNETSSHLYFNGGYDARFESWPAVALSQGIYDVLVGEIINANTGPYVGNTTVLSTRLVEAFNFTPYAHVTYAKDIGRTIEEMSHNLTLSLLSITDSNIPTTIRYTKTRLVFQYSRDILISTYLAATTAALFCLIIGLRELWTNGTAGDVSFSTVLVTTRNPALDYLCQGAYLAGSSSYRRLRKTKLKFGELWEGRSDRGLITAHAGFGAEGVVPMRKGVKYI